MGHCPIAKTETEKSTLEVEKEDNVADEDEEDASEECSNEKSQSDGSMCYDTESEPESDDEDESNEDEHEDDVEETSKENEETTVTDANDAKEDVEDEHDPKVIDGVLKNSVEDSIIKEKAEVNGFLQKLFQQVDAKLMSEMTHTLNTPE